MQVKENDQFKYSKWVVLLATSVGAFTTCELEFHSIGGFILGVLDAGFSTKERNAGHEVTTFLDQYDCVLGVFCGWLNFLVNLFVASTTLGQDRINISTL